MKRVHLLLATFTFLISLCFLSACSNENPDFQDVQLTHLDNGSWVVTGKYTGEATQSDPSYLIFDLLDSKGNVVSSAIGSRYENSEDFGCLSAQHIIETPINDESFPALMADLMQLANEEFYTGNDVASFEFKQALSKEEYQEYANKPASTYLGEDWKEEMIRNYS